MRFGSVQLSNHLSKYVRILCIACLLGFALALLSNSPAFAYSTEGVRWSGTPTSGCCANISIQFRNFTYTFDKQAFISGYSAWNSSPANVYFTANGGSLTVQDTYDKTTNLDGWTSYGTFFGYFTNADSYLNSYFTLGSTYTAQVLQGVAAHELGHAIGLGHTNGCVLMVHSTSTRISCNIHGPVADDVNGVNSLY